MAGWKNGRYGPQLPSGNPAAQQLGFRPLADGVCGDLKGAFGLACLGLEAAAPLPALLLAAELAGAVRVHRQVLLVCNAGCNAGCLWLASRDQIKRAF